jgi:hypothetical protein
MPQVSRQSASSPTHWDLQRPIFSTVSRWSPRSVFLRYGMSKRHRSLRAPWHRASDLGYVVWFAALRGLTASRAATVQLSVPVIAAFSGVVLLAEDVSLRLLIASIATLGGIWIVLAQPDRNADVR